MKKLLLPMAFAAILTSCSKRIDIPLPRTDTQITKKDTVALKINFFSEGKDQRFFMTAIDGEWQTSDNNLIKKFNSGGTADFELSTYGPEDEDGARKVTGTCIVHLQFYKWTHVNVDGAGIFTSELGTGTLASHIHTGAGTLRYDYKPSDSEEVAPVINIYLDGFMEK